MKEQIEESGLIHLLEMGGVFPDILEVTPGEVLTNLILAISLPVLTNRKVLLQTILEREVLLPTAVRNGISLPRPRNPLITNPQDQFVVIGFLQQGVDWKTLDSKLVHTLLLMVSFSTKNTFTTFRWSFFCRQKIFSAPLAKPYFSATCY